MDVAFPPGRQFALAWSIPADFGGMTSALLHRSRAFVRLAGTPVTILTFADQPDTVATEARLRASGEFVDGMSLLNIWDWFRDHVPSSGSLDLQVHPFTPLEPDGTTGVIRTRTDASGAVLQTDRYRADGSVLVSDRKDTPSGTRSVVLCDSDGVPVRSWGSLWGLYRFWLDELRQREPSFTIVDSKTAANFAATYKRKRAAMLHLVHNAHLEGAGPELRESRRAVFENLAAWDSVVLLTQRQRDDVAKLPGRHDNLAVIPNGRDLGVPERNDRPVSAGMVLSSLTGRKRVDHAVRAVAALSGVTLDVYGDGEEREAVDALVKELDAPVTMHGHRSDARARLLDASFLLLTSTSEGLPLVLVEAMAAGCIPIAYDVDYGPADVIRDGRNGFLVKSGDIDGLVAAIGRLQAMPARQVGKMRREARKSAAEFSDLAVTRLWAKEFRASMARRLATWERDEKKEKD